MSAEVVPDALDGLPGAAGDSTPVAARRMRLAWLVLWGGLVGFLLLCAGGAFSVFAFATRSSEVRTATLEPAHGTGLQVQRAGRREWISVSGKTALDEGDAVRTSGDTDALITLFDKSTVQVYYGSEVGLTTLRSSRFLDQEKTITITQRGGVANYSMADRSPYAGVDITVRTAQARVTLSDNSTARVVMDEGKQGSPPYTQVVAEAGTILVWVGEQAAHPVRGQQVRAYAGGTLVSPERATDQLFRNIEFVTPAQAPDEVLAGWTASPGPRDPLDGAHVITHTQGLDLEPRSVELTRAAGQSGPQRVILRQELYDRQVGFYGTLVLKVQVKVVDQPPDAAAGGPYPLALLLHYYDQDGRERTWEWSFYYDSAGATPAPDDLTSRVVKKGAWQERTFDLKQLVPNIAKLRSFEIVGGGKQFSVWISGLSLIGQ